MYILFGCDFLSWYETAECNMYKCELCNEAIKNPRKCEEVFYIKEHALSENH